jgi:hypothetical protein
MSSRTTDTDKKGMTSLKVKNTVDLRDVDESILEQNKVHLGLLWSTVVFVKLVIQVRTELVKVSNFVVNRFI